MTVTICFRNHIQTYSPIGCFHLTCAGVNDYRCLIGIFYLFLLSSYDINYSSRFFLITINKRKLSTRSIVQSETTTTINSQPLFEAYSLQKYRFFFKFCLTFYLLCFKNNIYWKYCSFSFIFNFTYNIGPDRASRLTITSFLLSFL